MEPGADTNDQNTHPYSCTKCKQRKVKCDRLDPKCSNCIKADVECTYRPPDPPKRRKRKASEMDVHTKMHLYEELLERHGISIDTAIHGDYSTSASPKKSTVTAKSAGQTALKNDNAGPTEMKTGLATRPPPKRPYAGSDLWNDIHAELEPQSQHAKSWLDEEEEEEEEDEEEEEGSETDQVQIRDVSNYQQPHDAEFLLGTPSSLDIRDLVPPAEYVPKLWQIYQQNVDPIMKLIHIPSVDKIISKGSYQLTSLSKSERALYVSVLSAAVNSIDDVQCQETFGQDRRSLLEPSRAAARQALGAANFLSTYNLTVLQAFVIYLVSVRREYDHPSLWSLTGIAIRIGRRMGLNGKQVKRNITPFEKEIQSRVWLQLLIYDAQMGELAGCAADWIGLLQGLRQPANFNDEDLHPEMTELPPEREGATDVIFTRMRYDLIITMQRMGILGMSPANAQKSGTELQEAQDKAIKEMEDMFVNKYLRYCDPLVPLHKLVTLSGHGMIGRVRLFAGHPRQYADQGASLPPEERDRLMDISLKLIEYHEVATTSEDLERFRWHVSMQVQYGALVFVLGELRRRSLDSQTEKAWDLVQQLYQNHPELIEEGHRRFYWALGSLILGVWQHREGEYEREYGAAPQPPEFIQQLRGQRERMTKEGRSKRGSLNGNLTTSNASSSVQQTPPFSDTHPSDFDSFDMFIPDLNGAWPPGFSTNLGSASQVPLYWSEWDEMLRDFER